MALWDGERWIDQRPPEPRRASRARQLFVHSSQVALEGALVALLIVGLIAGTAFAGKGGGGGGGKGGGGGGGTIALRMVTDQNGNGDPNWNDVVTFAASVGATPEPHVKLQCKQGGAVVYTADAGMYASYPWPWEQNMTLASSLWTSGAGTCTAW